MSHLLTSAAAVAGVGAVMDSDFSAADGWMRKTGAGAYEAIKSNMSAGAAPVAGTDDITLGYVVGSFWFDTTNDKMYVCLDNTDGAAVWIETTNIGGGGGDVTKVGTPVDSQIGVWTGDGTIEGHTSLTFDRSDFIITEAVNDGNPTFQMGAASAEQLSIQAIYDGAGQTLDRVDFTTKAASATADKGLMRFSVDEVKILELVDNGAKITGNLDLTGSIRVEASEREVITFIDTGSAVNEIQITNSVTGTGPTIAPSGDDTDIDLQLDGKGVGQVVIASGIVKPIRTETGATYNIALSDYSVLSDATTQAQTVSLPAIPAAGTEFRVKKIDADVNTTTVDTVDAALIDGAASVTLLEDEAYVFTSDGTNWHAF
jgi:hypothetical protein